MEDITNDEIGAVSEMFLQMNINRNPKISEYNTQNIFIKFLEEVLKKWKPSSLKDEWRPDYANLKSGGIDLKSKEVTSLIRSTGWELIKAIGRKIISGDFNLTTVSIPIKVMIPLTILQGIARSMFSYPIYFGLANMSQDPLEKFKLVITGLISPYHRSIYFLKPMNPILGETFEMLWEDGSHAFFEQTSHHPPVSHFIMYGPNNSYKFHGFSNFSSSAGLNSLKVVNRGKRMVEFPDGTKIAFNFASETYSNSFWGTLRHECHGDITFKDLTNGYECVVVFGSVKKKTSDYVQAEIKQGGKVLSRLYGSYLSYLEFDGVRYWDIRENINLSAFDIAKQPASSSLFRPDRLFLEVGSIEEGQREKERLENIQRNDRKLRENYIKSKGLKK